MLDAFKKLDKKFLMFFGIIICLPILIIVLLLALQSCGNRISTYEDYEKEMINVAKKYFEDKDKIPSEESDVSVVTLNTLVEKEYIKSTEDLLDDTSCKGKVYVRRNGSSIRSNNGGYLNYTINLECDKYKTVHIVDKLLEKIVTAESGLYKYKDEYIFRGDKVDNYFMFFGNSYRIMSIDKDGIMKLIKTETEPVARAWDNKFNVEVNKTFGKNIYKDSLILNYLLDDYENLKKINTAAKQHIVAYDVCIGKRSNVDYTISREIDCSERLENQVVSLINVSDFALASIDPDCKFTNSRSCKNYNYLSKFATSSWTPNVSSDNTYDVFFVSDGLQYFQSANLNYNEYNMVIYVDGNELYTSGSGTLSNPYVME